MEGSGSNFSTGNEPGILVSVIISFLNEQRFLGEAIESILSQEYSHWEIILVDDGSSDGSTEIAKDFASAYPGKIVYTDHPNHSNQGLSASRNHGISLAKGDLIAILDADDVWLPAKLRLQVEVMTAHPEVALLCEASEYWYSWNTLIPYKADEIIQVGRQRDRVFLPPQLSEMLYPLSDGAAPCPSGVMVKRSAYNKHGFESQFKGKNQLYEDQAFFAKYYLNEPVYISSMCNNRYRQREGSLVQKVTHEGNYAVVRHFFLRWLQQYIAENNLRYTRVNLLLKKALEPYDNPTLYFLKRLRKRIITRLKIIFHR
jgi:glycosyltransferase involved in cell wall biosynthesis